VNVSAALKIVIRELFCKDVRQVFRENMGPFTFLVHIV
jgi:hypothetical protein